jgi:hypothetical protein
MWAERKKETLSREGHAGKPVGDMGQVILRTEKLKTEQRHTKRRAENTRQLSEKATPVDTGKRSREGVREQRPKMGDGENERKNGKGGQ